MSTSRTRRWTVAVLLASCSLGLTQTAQANPIVLVRLGAWVLGFSTIANNLTTFADGLTKLVDAGFHLYDQFGSTADLSRRSSAIRRARAASAQISAAIDNALVQATAMNNSIDGYIDKFPAGTASPRHLSLDDPKVTDFGYPLQGWNAIQISASASKNSCVALEKQLKALNPNVYVGRIPGIPDLRTQVSGDTFLINQLTQLPPPTTAQELAELARLKASVAALVISLGKCSAALAAYAAA